MYDPSTAPPIERESGTFASDHHFAVRTWLWVGTVAVLAGALFAGLSTSDFVNHLDRQVHAIHCSFIPGSNAELGENGCRTVMLSPYSSIFRASMWGGMPISLGALAVFSYLVFRFVYLLRLRNRTRHDTLFLIAATALPLLMSGIYGALAVTKIGAVCKLCVGIYVSSVVAFLAACLAHRKAPAANPDAASPVFRWTLWFGEGVAFVALLSAIYLVAAPATPPKTKGCGTLAKADDAAGIFLPVGAQQGAPAIAVLDPLCPACKAFDERLVASGLDQKLATNLVLFPLDSTCNWMVKESLHPGACALSEAMLCAKDEAATILNYAFAHQEELRDLAKSDEPALRKRIETTFPQVKGCLGSAAIKNKVNKSLRWTVANALPVLTPQLFVNGHRLCDEDTDLGLEYTLTNMLRSGD
jgi:uncharacterized membrane protein